MKGLFGQGLWTEVLRAKYLRKIHVVDWFHYEKKQVLNASNIWRGLPESVPSELLDDVEGGKQETY